MMEINKERKGMEKRFFNLCEKVVRDCKLDLYDLNYLPGSHELRVFIWNPDSKTAELDDCVEVDKALSPYIETEEWMPEQLTLEVSSPGLFRDLNSLKHFESALGEQVKLHLKKPIENSFGDTELPKELSKNKKIVACLKEVSDKKIICEWDGTKFEVPFEQLKKANLEAVF